MGNYRYFGFMVLTFLSILIQNSCNKKEDCRYPTQDAGFSFRLVDQFGINLIAQWGSVYRSDSTFLTKADGTHPNQLNIGADGNISLFIPDSYNEALDTAVTRRFFLYLPDFQGHPGADTDTLTFQYRFSKTNDHICFENLQIVFNDSLYQDGPYTDFVLLTKYY